MKGSEKFKQVIKQYLDARAETDELFKEKYLNEKKNIDDCITYILNTVKKSGCCGFDDDEIFGIAIHYYDEEKIDIGGSIGCNVVVNHRVELTEKEIAEAKEDAIKKIHNEVRQKIMNKPKAVKQENTSTQASLF